MRAKRINDENFLQIILAEKISSLSAQGVHVEAVGLRGEDEERHDRLVCEKIDRHKYSDVKLGEPCIFT